MWGPLLLFCWGVRLVRAPCGGGGGETRASPIHAHIHRRRARAAIGPRREGRCFLRRACKVRSRGGLSYDRPSVRGRVSRVRSRISRAHDLTAWNASALGQRARPTG